RHLVRDSKIFELILCPEERRGQSYHGSIFLPAGGSDWLQRSLMEKLLRISSEGNAASASKGLRPTMGRRPASPLSWLGTIRLPKSMFATSERLATRSESVRLRFVFRARVIQARSSTRYWN